MLLLLENTRPRRDGRRRLELYSSLQWRCLLTCRLLRNDLVNGRYRMLSHVHVRSRRRIMYSTSLVVNGHIQFDNYLCVTIIINLGIPQLSRVLWAIHLLCGPLGGRRITHCNLLVSSSSYRICIAPITEKKNIGASKN